MTSRLRPRRLAASTLLAAGAALAACAHRGPRVDPELRLATPDSFRVAFETSRGRFDVVAHADWAPVGADRFYYLVRHRYYDDARFFRVVPGFVAQFGLSGDSAVNAAWRRRRLADDSVRRSNTRGTLAFARGGPQTRTVQVYVNLGDNRRLDSLGGIGFAPFAQVVSGMAVVDSLHGYGEGPPRGRGPAQDSIALRGNAYLRRAFPAMDYVRRAWIVEEWR